MSFNCLDDLSPWTAKVAGHGSSRFSVGPDGWRMDVSFDGAMDNWAYPKFKLPCELDLGVMRARILKPAGNMAILANPKQIDGFWANDLFPADGELWKMLAVGMGSREKSNALEVSHP